MDNRILAVAATIATAVSGAVVMYGIGMINEGIANKHLNAAASDLTGFVDSVSKSDKSIKDFDALVETLRARLHRKVENDNYYRVIFKFNEVVEEQRKVLMAKN